LDCSHLFQIDRPLYLIIAPFVFFALEEYQVVGARQQHKVPLLPSLDQVCCLPEQDSFLQRQWSPHPAMVVARRADGATALSHGGSIHAQFY
jgi:hypothetical protein